MFAKRTEYVPERKRSIEYKPPWTRAQRDDAVLHSSTAVTHGSAAPPVGSCTTPPSTGETTTHVPGGKVPTRGMTVPSRDGEGTSATVAASAATPMPTVTWTEPGSKPGTASCTV